MCKSCQNKLLLGFNADMEDVQDASLESLQTSTFWQTVGVKRYLFHKFVKGRYIELCRLGYFENKLWATEEELALSPTPIAKREEDPMAAFSYAHMRQQVRLNALMTILEDEEYLRLARAHATEKFLKLYKREAEYVKGLNCECTPEVIVGRLLFKVSDKRTRRNLQRSASLRASLCL